VMDVRQLICQFLRFSCWPASCMRGAACPRRLSDDARSPRRHPCCHPLDPWMDLYLPAWLGDSEVLRSALRRVPSLPSASVGDGWAVGHARARSPRRASGGRAPLPDGAVARWQRGRRAPGGPRSGRGVDGTAPGVGAHGWRTGRCRLRIWRLRCSIAAMCARRGGRPRSASGMPGSPRGRALDALLTDCPAPAAVWLDPGRSGVVRGRRSASPTPANGWIGEERLRRRKSADPYAPPEGTAARDSGTPARWATGSRCRASTSGSTRRTR